LFFSAFSTYRMLLVNEFHLKYFSYGSALVSALVLSKIILLGEYAHLGRRFEGTALIVSTLYKSLAFGLLTAAFHVLEEGIKELVLRKTPFHPGESRNLNELLARTLVMFCAFIPFFAFRETARVLGRANCTNFSSVEEASRNPGSSPDLPRKLGNPKENNPPRKCGDLLGARLLDANFAGPGASN
jgi:hypothetical protein